MPLLRSRIQQQNNGLSLCCVVTKSLVWKAKESDGDSYMTFKACVVTSNEEGGKQKQYIHTKRRCKNLIKWPKTQQHVRLPSICEDSWHIVSRHDAYWATLPLPFNVCLSFISAPNTLILSASCNLPDFFSGILLDILLRTKPFLVFYNSSPLAGARQALGATHKNIPFQLPDITGNADTSTSWIHSFTRSLKLWPIIFMGSYSEIISSNYKSLDQITHD